MGKIPPRVAFLRLTDAIAVQIVRFRSAMSEGAHRSPAIGGRKTGGRSPLRPGIDADGKQFKSD
jgi:hypothetical protein